MDRETRQAIAYVRVSTARQGQSGLGLDAQEQAVAAYVEATGLELVGTFVEVETGTGKRKRPELDAAIAAAREQGALLLVAKIDRLARNVAFVTQLMDSGLDFVALDMPDANRLTVHVVAALAEHEGRLIATRTRDALQAAKRRGTKLGTPENLTHEAQVKGAQARRDAAIQRDRAAVALASALRREGSNFSQIARELNDAGHRTGRTGRTKHCGISVRRMLQRAETAGT